MDQPERVRYFDQQFLRVEDFTAEQDYHRDMRRRHNRMLHTPGIADGLLLAADGTGVKITPGSAIPGGTDINGGGAEIVLATERRQELSTFSAGADVYVTIAFSQEQARFRDDAGVQGHTRWRENPTIEAFTTDPTATAPADPKQPLRVLLGRVTRGGTGGTQIVGIDGTGRRLAGAAQSEVSLTPRDPSVTEPDWVRLRWLARGEAELRGSLRIQPGGPTPGNLTVAGSIVAGQRLGVGIAAPAHALHVTGNAQIGNAFVGDVGHGPGWAGFSHKDAIGQASYGLLQSNDGRATLINKRSGGGTIEFRVDNSPRLSMDDAGTTEITGDLRARAVFGSAGAIAAGVSVGRDPGGGVDYPWEYETVGVTAPNYNLRLQSPNGVFIHAGGAERLGVYANGVVGIHGKEAFRGDDPWLRLNQSGQFTAGVHTPGLFAPVALNVGGANGYGNPGGGNAWISGSLEVYGDVRLGSADRFVYIGGNQTGPFIQFHDDLWFADPQNGTIWLRNHNDTNWGTLVGFFSGQSSIRHKTGVRRLDGDELEALLEDTARTDLVRFRYRGEDEETGRDRVGVVSERCPEYLLAPDGESVVLMEYTAMLHGALKALTEKVRRLEEAR